MNDTDLFNAHCKYHHEGFICPAESWITCLIECIEWDYNKYVKKEVND